MDPYALRVTHGIQGEGSVVVYLARTARRVRNNIALDYARSLGRPVVFVEPPLTGRRGDFVASHAPANARDAATLGIEYVFGEYDLSRAHVITDEDPLAPTPYTTVDHNGIIPMRAFGKEMYSARFLRDRAHRLFADYWFPVDGPVHPLIADFIANRLPGYAEGRNRGERHVSGLSPYLHFGTLGIHEVAQHVLLSGAPQEDIDAFLEEAVIRRELSFNLCFYNPRHASLDALPDWARRTLDKHRRDRRKPVYSFSELEAANTHDEVWNRAQRQLVDRGTIHGYLRMLWGKKIIEWSETPEAAHAAMLELHERYALDGVGPNTHAGILWCFGKHDRPWAPERPIFGTVRWMSSEQAARKVKLRIRG